MNNISRIKVVFDRNIHERNEDANPSYVVVNHIQDPRISDFCDHLISLFDLSQVCPHGITLSYISGDLIPPWETSHILRETDIVRVGMRERQMIIPDEIEVNAESFEG